VGEGSERTLDVRLRAAVESAPSGLLMLAPDGRIVLVNREVERLFGYSREELLGQPVEVLVPERFRERHRGDRGGFFADPRARAMGAGRELFGVRKDGREVPVEIGLTPVVTDEGLFVISSIVDISARKAAEAERRELEEQLRQAQKMEAVGRLAGGVAHDFNNVLASVLGFAELLRDTIRDPRLAADLEQIELAAQRGRELVDRILRFARRQELEKRPLDLPGVISDTVGLLRGTLPASIEIRTTLASAPERVLGDAVSLQQALVNLATNAAHAMPLGGRLEITAETFYARDHFARMHPGLREGRYALVRVRDSGRGMDEATRARALEPFFTTKPPGEGSGLGLSIVHGIVQDHGGALWIESEPTLGTTVSCLLPLPDDGLDTPEAAERSEAPRGSGERILYVDDEPALATLGRRRLVALGYRVEATEDPREALAWLEARPQEFDLLITDYSMPGLNGLELAQRARRQASDLPILLLTGYTEAFSEASAERVVSRIARKPIAAIDLAVAVRELLDTASGAGSGQATSPRAPAP